MVTALENIRLSTELRELVFDITNSTSSISSAIGLPTWHVDFRIPVIGELTLYEAIKRAYEDDVLEIGRICCPDCNGVTLHGSVLEGDDLVNAIRGEIAIRRDIKKHYPMMYQAYNQRILENSKLTGAYLALINHDSDIVLDDITGLTDDEINEQLNEYPIESIFDCEKLGFELADCSLRLYKEEVEHASK